MKTAHTFYDPFSTTGTFARAVEISDIVEVAGKRGYVTSLGRKYMTVRIYGGKSVKVSPLAADVVFTGETHW